MTFLDTLLGRSAPADITAPDARTMEAIIERPVVNVAALNRTSLRTGMWVVTPSGVGILTGCRIDGTVEVTLSKPDGSTRMTLNADDQSVPHVIVCDLSQVAQAGILDIPAARRGDVELLRSMGYK